MKEGAPVKNNAVLIVGGLALCALAPAALANTTAQAPVFSQAWDDTTLISVDNNWTLVPGLMGYTGAGLTSTTGADPQTILADGTTTAISVYANKSDPTAFFSGGLAEFQGTLVPDATVALAGSGAASAPFLLLSLNTSTNFQLRVQYDLRDIEGGADNAVQAVALHYRVGNTGSWTNIPAGFVADATTGPNLATKVTHIDVTLPVACENKPLVQLRVLTTNALGNDEWVGVDNISVIGSSATPTQPSTWGMIKARYR